MPETPVFSTAAVAAPHRRVAETGQTILAAGGNAIEAVIAMAATCAVVLPHLNGLGGDGFLIAREPRGRVHALDASGPAGTMATIDRYREKDYETVPLHGPDAALTVAGAVSGWALGLELAKALGGHMPLDMLLADAIGLARDGSAISPSEARVALDASLLEAPNFSGTFLRDGKRQEAGSLRRQPKLADTIERLAHVGLQDFYRGDVGREIALDLERLGSPILRRDLETYAARVTKPLSVRLGQAEIYTLPAPTEGLASLLALGIADRSDVRPGETAEYLHATIEAAKRALALTDRLVADPREIEGDWNDFLAGDFLAREALQTGRRAADYAPTPRIDGGSVWIGCIDRDGLAVSYGQSVHGPFGSGCVLPKTGIHWHNRGAAFSLDSASLNLLGPGRKPPHTLNPALAVFADDRVLAYGGPSIVQAQMLWRYAYCGMELGDAVGAPRWAFARRGNEGAILKVEDCFDRSLMRALGQLGHPVEEIAADALSGGGMIVRHARRGRVEAMHDPRGDGDAMGL